MTFKDSGDAPREPFWDLRMLRSRVACRALDLRAPQTRVTTTSWDHSIRSIAIHSTPEPGEPWWGDRHRRVRLYLRRVETAVVPTTPYDPPRLSLAERAALARFAILLAADVLDESPGTLVERRLRRRLARFGRLQGGSHDLAILRVLASDLAQRKIARRTDISGPLELRLFAEAGIEWLPTTLAQARLVRVDPLSQPSPMEDATARVLVRGFAGIDLPGPVSFEILRFVKSDGSPDAAMGYLRRHAMEVQSRPEMDDARRRHLLAAFLALLQISARRREDAPLRHLDPMFLQEVAQSPLSEGRVRQVATALVRFPDRLGTDAVEEDVWAVLDEASNPAPASVPGAATPPTDAQRDVDAAITTLGVDAHGVLTINRRPATYERAGGHRTMTIRHQAVAALMGCWNGKHVKLADRPLRDLRCALEYSGAPGRVDCASGHLHLVGEFFPTQELVAATGTRPTLTRTP